MTEREVTAVFSQASVNHSVQEGVYPSLYLDRVRYVDRWVGVDRGCG